MERRRRRRMSRRRLRRRRRRRRRNRRTKGTQTDICVHQRIKDAMRPCDHIKI
jgi:hypothetical protein